jgi:hypothetical protein
MLFGQFVADVSKDSSTSSSYSPKHPILKNPQPTFLPIIIIIIIIIIPTNARILVQN